MKLELSSFEKALASLIEALAEFDRTQSQFVKDACIQRFEYTYELAHKLLKRQLEAMSPNPSEIDQMSFPDMIRSGAERGLLANGWDEWRRFRDARNATSHAYNEKKANEVFVRIPAFRDEAAFLLARLQERHAE
ncbi:nucleotidyltransferase substrate binding protein, HI0074 family [Loktanella sp. DSM 29012]|uniref:nucleotidyltransferase substrate binding protein n=1 Tax=Loktanella sp. DSM 29012 TaxID=1881056 RepID=UPI0008C97C7D|nr:nucleotidyltransferase substrate binding protein [Loktanella sp. DSM 29012]SEP66195.1 nucleotidyltransferase substrate binding protein, HI0074 family [Loktanella sp. DSM 29012]